MKRPRVIRVGAAATILGILCGVGFLFWPITLEAASGQSSTMHTACGNAIHKGQAYNILIRGNGAPLQFMSSAQYQPIEECNSLRLRNRILGTGALAVSAAAVVAGLALSRRSDGQHGP